MTGTSKPCGKASENSPLCDGVTPEKVTIRSVMEHKHSYVEFIFERPRLKPGGLNRRGRPLARTTKLWNYQTWQIDGCESDRLNLGKDPAGKSVRFYPALFCVWE